MTGSEPNLQRFERRKLRRCWRGQASSGRSGRSALAVASDTVSAMSASDRLEPQAPTFDELYGLFEQLQQIIGFDLTMATPPATRDAGVTTAPLVVTTVSIETEVVATRSLAGSARVRGYERALELSSQTPIAQLYDVFR